MYLSRLWTDKPVKLKGETLNQIKQGGEREKRGEREEEEGNQSEGICERT